MSDDEAWVQAEVARLTIATYTPDMQDAMYVALAATRATSPGLDIEALQRSLSEHERDHHGIVSVVEIPPDCIADLKQRYDAIAVPEGEPAFDRLSDDDKRHVADAWLGRGGS